MVETWLNSSHWTWWGEIRGVLYTVQIIGQDKALCTIRSHGTKSHLLVRKLRSGTSKTKADPHGLVRVALFWKSHSATCSPANVILYHVTRSCKGPITGGSHAGYVTNDER